MANYPISVNSLPILAPISRPTTTVVGSPVLLRKQISFHLTEVNRPREKGSIPDVKSHLHGAGAGRTPSSGVAIVKPARAENASMLKALPEDASLEDIQDHL
jgi:hypothetical protein